ncbi:UNVERIFIED_CONTAM: hypothetical protein FKN15_039138 [Acipenser sinensis]
MSHSEEIDKRVETLSVDLLKCYTCTDLTDETMCKDITVCGFGDKFCKTTYKLTGNVDLLKCYTCTDLTDETMCKDITVCGFVDKFCKTTYKLTGNAPLIKSCQTCDNEKVESNCAEKDCATPSSFCQRKIDFTKDVNTLSCLQCDAQTDETQCKAGVCTVGTFCQNSYSFTNLVKALFCYTCDKQSDETLCTTVKACGSASGKCSSVYETGVDGKLTVTKGCEASPGACVPGRVGNKQTTCCDTDFCNEPKLSCYTCNGLADEKQCTTVTACSDESKFCKTVRNTIAGKMTAVTKTCDATCTASSTAFQTVECCQASQCNEYQERATGASPSTQASSLLLAVSISLLTMLLKSP